MKNALTAPVLDPRGTQGRPKIKLAPRPTLEELKQGPVIFYDNTKLGFCNYMEVFHRLRRNFIEMGIHNLVDFRETVRGKSTRDLKDYAAKLAQAKPKAAVLALGDVGTSPATAILTMAMEELGVPSVYITAPPGSDLVRGVVFYRAGHLCLAPIDIYQGSSVEEIQKKVDELTPGIVDALTLPPGRIEKRAAVNFHLDQEAPSSDGFLKAAERIGVSEGETMEPAAGIEAYTELFDSLHLGDGLPIVPPTEKRIERMLSYCPWPEQEILAREIGPSGKDITVRDVAVCAVMAGCKPQAMPILVWAFRAMEDKRYNFLQSVTTSHPGGNLVLVSGPLAQEIGIHGGPGCLGPGFPANMTIGRAENLVLINVCRAVTGDAGLA